MSARVRHWSLTVRGADPPLEAVALQRAVEEALEIVSGELGAALVVVERQEIHAREVRRWSTGAEVGELREKIVALLRRRVGSGERSGLAVFESEAVARAGLLQAMVESRTAEFPWSSLRHWGRTARDIDRWAKPVVGDALAALEGDAVRWLTPGIALRLLGRFTSGDGPRRDLAVLPTAIAEGYRQLLHEAKHDPTRRLLAAAALFRAWPPARALDLPTDDTRADDGAVMASEAVHLVLWQGLLDATGFDPTADFERAVDGVLARWAVGRALTDPRVPSADPILLAFAGEPVEGSGPVMTRFAETDPWPLARAAARLLVVGGTARLGTLFDGTGVLFDDRRILDVLFDETDALAAAAQRLAASVGEPVPIEETDTIPAPVRDGLQRVDVPALPSPWRAAVIAAGSALEALALERWGRVPPRRIGGQLRASRLVAVAERSPWVGEMPQRWRWADGAWSRDH